MDDRSSLVQEAQRQLAELEASADALLSGLTEPSGIPSATPTQAVTRASNALKAFESVVRRIKPLLDATATRDAPLDESILNAAYLEIDAKREIPAVSTANIQPIKIPQQPASSLNGLIDTFREVLGVEMLLQNEGGDSPQLIANYFNAFHLRVLLQSRNSLVPIAVNVRPIAQIPETGPLPSSNRTTMRLSSSSPSSSSSLPLLFDRLTSAAAIARLAFVDQWERDTKGASPLEMLLLWLATCAVCLTRTDRHIESSILEFDPGTGSLVPKMPDYRDFSWQKGWETAAAGLKPKPSLSKMPDEVRPMET